MIRFGYFLIVSAILFSIAALVIGFKKLFRSPLPLCV